MTCPEWSQDDDEHRSPACFAGHDAAIRQAESDCLRGPPTRQHIEEWHRQFFAALVPKDYYAGNCRGIESGKPCLAYDLGVYDEHGNGTDATPHQNVRADLDAMLEELRRYIAGLELRWSATSVPNRAKAIATLVGSAVAHFIRIHPFMNGNGRTSRLFWRALLRRFGLPAQFAGVKRPAGPYESVMAAAMVGNTVPCIELVFRAMMNKPPPSTPH